MHYEKPLHAKIKWVPHQDYDFGEVGIRAPTKQLDYWLSFFVTVGGVMRLESISNQELLWSLDLLMTRRSEALQHANTFSATL